VNITHKGKYGAGCCVKWLSQTRLNEMRWWKTHYYSGLPYVKSKFIALQKTFFWDR